MSELLYIYIFPQTALESALVPRRFKFSQSQLRVNIITFPPAESRAASQEGLCVSSVFLQQRTISCRRWVKNVLITNQLFCFRIDETFLHLFLFASTNRLLLLLLLTNVPVDSDTELILTDWLYWTVTQRLQTLRGDCETKTKTFIHPEQRGGKLHNSGKSQCVFERQWDSKRERERRRTLETQNIQWCQRRQRRPGALQVLRRWRCLEMKRLSAPFHKKILQIS